MSDYLVAAANGRFSISGMTIFSPESVAEIVKA
jgi:hypothetical protein